MKLKQDDFSHTTRTLKFYLSAEVLHSNRSVDEKLTYFLNECLTDEFWELFRDFACALQEYYGTQSQCEKLFKAFQECKDDLKVYNCNIYYGMLEWKDFYIKKLRHLID